MRVASLFAALACALPPSPLAAQAPWSLEAVLRHAEQASPEVRAAEAALDTARAHERYAAVPVVGNPILGVRAMVGVPDDAAAIYAAYLGIPFDVSRRAGLRSEEADLRITEAEARLDIARNEARAEARTRYTDLALAGQELLLAERRAALAAALREATEERRALGAATALDGALAAQEAAVAEANRIAALRALEEAREALRTVLGLGPEEGLEVGALGLPPDAAELDASAAITAAVTARRESVAARLATDRLEVSEDRLWAEAVSPLVLSAEYELQGNTQRNQTFGIGASMALPLFWMNDGERAVALGEAGEFRLGAELEETRIAREASAAVARLELALTELEALDDEALPAAALSVSLAEELLASGAIDVFRLLTVRREHHELESRRVALLRDAWRARTELDRALGGAER